MVVFVVPAKRRSFAKRMKWINLFLAWAKHFFSLVKLSTKKAIKVEAFKSEIKYGHRLRVLGWEGDERPHVISFDVELMVH